MAAPEERWRRLEEIFHRALDLEREERGAYLDAACAGGKELRAEAEAMIGADTGAGERIEGAIHGTFELAAADSDGEERRRIGPYEVLREIGRAA